jgi:hypothetical protein
VTTLVRECRTNLPLLRDRRRRASRRWHWSHDDKRVILHRYGRLDLERVWLARIAIGNASWVHPFWGVFGDPTILLRYAPRYTARVIKFPAKAGMK